MPHPSSSSSSSPSSCTMFVPVNLYSLFKRKSGVLRRVQLIQMSAGLVTFSLTLILYGQFLLQARCEGGHPSAACLGPPSASGSFSLGGGSADAELRNKRNVLETTYMSKAAVAEEVGEVREAAKVTQDGGGGSEIVDDILQR